MAIVRNTIIFPVNTTPTVVENYSALPDVTTVTGKFYWCSNSQGTSWLPGGLGGTYYNNGLYYSNGVSWEFIDVPYQATQAEVEAGVNNDKFVTPFTLNSVLPTKTSDLINDGDDGNPFISLLDLPSNLILYPTTASSDISGYVKMVTDIHDPSYNTTAVDVSTGSISGTAQLISSLATSANIINGNPGIFNITTIGNITRTAGSGQAEFFFLVYKRELSGTETLITQSSNTIPVINTGYSEFSATALWNDGDFLLTDRIVIKYYANRISGGSNPTYNFQFGGMTPVRTLVPIPLSVVPSIPLDGLSDVTITSVANNEVLGYETATSLWKNKSIASLLGFTPANDASVVHIAGTETITGSKTFSVDTVINGHKVGRGGGNVASNIMIGNTNTANTGVSCTFIGTDSGQKNATGVQNTFYGVNSGNNNLSGIANLFLGFAAGFNNLSGNNSTALGHNAGRFIADGVTSATIISNSVFVGQNTKPLADNQTNQIVIGYNSVGLGNNTTVLGNSSTTLTAIYGSTIFGGTSVNTSAILQADSTTKGFLPPRMTNAQRIAIASPAIGLIVYCTDTVAGLYVYKSTGWTFII